MTEVTDEVTEEVPDEAPDEPVRGIAAGPVEEVAVGTGNAGSSESKVTTEPLRASELLLPIFFAFVLALTMCT